MKTTQSSCHGPDHPTVAGTFHFKSNCKAIEIGFTEQQLSPHAGSATFWTWLRPLDWCRQLAAALRNVRFWLFVTAGVLSHPAGKTTIKLAVPARERHWWQRLWEKILSPFPNCNAVENRPVFTT